MGKESFNGVFQQKEDGFRLTLQLARKIPSFFIALDILKKTGVRLKKAETIEKNNNGEMGCFDRDFRSMSRHGLVVAFATDSIADLIGLDSDDRNDLVISALLHDATKRIEVVMIGYRALVDQKKDGEKEKKLLSALLTNVEVTNVDGIIHQTAHLNPIEFIYFFDTQINEPVLKSMLALSPLSKEKQQRIINIAISDSMGALPIGIARAAHFSKSMNEEDATFKEFKQLSVRLRRDKKLPHVYGNQREFLGMILSYCDGITKGAAITTIDQRLKDVLAREVYCNVDEEVRSFYYGRSFFEVSRLTGHVVERIIKNEGVKKGKIDTSLIPEELSTLIVNNLQSRLGKNI